MEVRCLQWSLHSQDLNIIELIWDFIDPRLQKDICQKRFSSWRMVNISLQIYTFCTFVVAFKEGLNLFCPPLTYFYVISPFLTVMQWEHFLRFTLLYSQLNLQAKISCILFMLETFLTKSQMEQGILAMGSIMSVETYKLGGLNATMTQQ